MLILGLDFLDSIGRKIMDRAADIMIQSESNIIYCFMIFNIIKFDISI